MQELEITLLGQELIADVIAGNDTITFTKMVGSDYDYSTSVLSSLTSLQGIKQTVDVDSVNVNADDDTSVEITAIFDNSSISSGYFVNTIGLYAKNSSNIEILYAVAINQDASDYLHASNQGATESILYKLITNISDTSNVTIETSSSGYASALDLIEHNSQKVFSDNVGAHGLRYVNNTLQIKNNSNQWVNAFSLLDVYPIGSIYISTTSTNPGTLFGGTWVEFGKGRTLVGIDTSDSNFNYSEKTGGSKYLQSHNHSFTGSSTTTDTASASHTHTVSRSTISSIANDCIDEKLKNLRSYIQEDTKYTFGGSGGRPGTSNTYTSSRSDIYNDNSHWSSGSGTFDTGSATCSHSHSFKATGSVGYAGSGSSENLQPYITTYMWKRTA